MKTDRIESEKLKAEEPNIMNRIAIVSSPRSGNSWTRGIIADAISAEQMAVHDYTSIPKIPERCVLQIHWYREPLFQRFLKNEHFQVVVISRHPLDLLLSVLHFIHHEPETQQWLLGNCEIPHDLKGKSPSSEDFLQYCLGFGSENLLSVSYQWWQDSGSIKCRYEDLVKDPIINFEKIISSISGNKIDMRHILERHSLKRFQEAPNKHGWRGDPGHWTTMIPRASADQIYQRHQRLFETFGYPFTDYQLEVKAAEANWQAARVLPRDGTAPA